MKVSASGSNRTLAAGCFDVSSADEAAVSGGSINGCFAANEVVLGLSICATMGSLTRHWMILSEC